MARRGDGGSDGGGELGERARVVERNRVHAEAFGGVLEAQPGHLVGRGVESMHGGDGSSCSVPGGADPLGPAPVSGWRSP